MKRFRLTGLLLLLLLQFTFARDFTFSCPSKDISEKAKGTYFFETTSTMFTYTIDNTRINIMQMINDSIQSQSIIHYPYTKDWFAGYNESDFIQFDDNGNVFLILTTYAPAYEKDSAIILKYDPVNNKAYTYMPDLPLLPHGMTVSDDGRWIFVCGSKDYETTRGDGIPTVIAIPTSNPDKYETLFESTAGRQMPAFFYNLCFDSITKSLYFTHLGWIQEYDACIGQGLYVAKPDVSNNYIAKNVERHTNLNVYHIYKFNAYSKEKNLPLYDLALKEIKESCGNNLNYDNIELSLKYFKDPYNSKFKELYKEDANGNPLTDEKAMAFLFDEQTDLFRDFISDNTWNYGSKGYCSTFPLDLLCLDKTTGESAYKGDKTFITNRASEEVGFIFSTDFGLYMQIKREDGQGYSELHQITDKKGNFVKTNEMTASYRLNSIYDKSNRNVIVNKDFVIFFPLDKSDLFLAKEGSFLSLRNQFPDCTEFTMEQAKEAEKNILGEEVKEIQIKDEIKDIKAVSSTVIIILSILLGISVLIILILIFIYFIKPMINKTVQDKIHVLRIKRDKKYIFDIQEKERGKISRDIHDSIIQDIRAIRLNTEMLKVDSDSETRKQQIITTATNCVINLRNICYNLTPAELATHVDGDNSKIELISIIQTLVTQFIERTHVPCSIQIEKDFSYPVFEKETSQNLFRIIQETLTNIEKHSYATQCSIYIKEKIINNLKYMAIYISDDGIGCDIQKLLKRRKKMHFGLQNIIDRVELIGAEIEFHSEQGDGMEIIISVPII